MSTTKLSSTAESLAPRMDSCSSKAAESQGQRLSTYASSSSSSYVHNPKNSPKTPKKSSTSSANAADKLSNRSSSKEESLSPHRFISGYNSYTSINSPLAKENHAECILKCTCKHSSYTSLRSPKQYAHAGATAATSTSTIHEKNVQKISKISCDAATSPNRFSQRSPKPSGRLGGMGDASTACNELRISDEKTITAKTNASPRRLIATRNAATSPGLDRRKQLNPKCELQPQSPEISVKAILEKSNSLGESKPARTLRTTRSLSPRPPVRHQHAITVCDENDIVSVKISPNEEFEDEAGEGRISKKKYKAQSEQTSPNLSDLGTTFSYENRTNNKSTGCLVYVPSDPWIQMSEMVEVPFHLTDKSKKKKPGKFSPEVRSLSRGDLLPMNDDPWIWRNSPGPTDPAKAKSPRQEKYRQAKSFSVTRFELADVSHFAKSGEKNSAKNSNRPKLQRCKSPIVIDDEATPFLNDVSRACTCSAATEGGSKTSNQNLLSPRKDIVGNTETASNNQNSTNCGGGTKCFLNVTNANLIQSRHSFSSISPKDDELQLNIRRLSEQIKKPSQSGVVSGGDKSGASGADFTDYLNQFRTSEAQKAKAAAAVTANRSSAKNVTDAVLETTC